MSQRQDYDRMLRTVLAINNQVLGVVLGILMGLGIFAATLWLVFKGGPSVGPHMALLGQFFPGYSVTYFGSVLGLIYGFIVGYIAGWSIGRLYNQFVYLRHR